MHSKDVLKFVTRPALDTAGLLSLGALVLVHGTGLCESEYNRLKQIQGPALGLWQCEPRTHAGLKKWLGERERRLLRERVLATCFMGALPGDDALQWNLRYAALICRLHYYQLDFNLPVYDDAQGMVDVYRKWYNTPLGKSTQEKSLLMFQRAIREVESVT